jgi:hypothetical protein
MTTPRDTTDDWTSAWPDALAFAVGLVMAWRGRWTATDLVWSLWLSSLVVGYATIVWTVLRPVVQIAGGAWRQGVLMVQTSAQTTLRSAAVGVPFLVLGGLFLLTFFAIHFGFFHYVHSQFLGMFFPIDTGTGGRSGMVGMATYVEVARRYWWFLPAAFLAERGAFLTDSRPADRDRSVPAAALVARGVYNPNRMSGGMMAPYRNVVRMHILIFFFAFAHVAGLDSFAVYAVVYAVYFFPWRLLRRREA